jgi:hypothetical protein
MSTKPEQTGAVIFSGDVACDLIRRIAGMVKNSQNTAEATQISDSLVELGSIIRSLQKTMFELHVENNDLKRQLQAVVDLKAARQQFRYEQGVYWKYDEAGNRVDGPFCPTCLGEDHVRRLVHGAASGLYRCVHHQALFTTAPIGGVVRTAGA